MTRTLILVAGPSKIGKTRTVDQICRALDLSPVHLDDLLTAIFRKRQIAHLLSDIGHPDNWKPCVPDKVVRKYHRESFEKRLAETVIVAEGQPYIYSWFRTPVYDAFADLVDAPRNILFQFYPPMQVQLNRYKKYYPDQDQNALLAEHEKFELPTDGESCFMRGDEAALERLIKQSRG